MSAENAPEQVPSEEFRRVMAGMALGCVAGLFLPMAAFRLLQAFSPVSAARFGEAALYLLIGAGVLWAGARRSPVWRFAFAGVAVVMAVGFLSHASGIEGFGSDGLPVLGDRPPSEETPAYLAAGASVAMAIGGFLFGGFRAMRRR